MRRMAGMADLSGMAIGALRMRQALGREICRKLRTEWRGEEGAAEALKKYEAQTKRYTEELARRRKLAREESGEEQPPAVRVKAKAAKLGARRK
jgi:hypothetical protein